jgi:hypothetical protein
MTPTTPSKHARPPFELRMSSDDEDAEVAVSYRGRRLMVTFLPDEDLGTPSGGEHEIPLTDAQEAAWDKGEWWYHHLLVQAVDDQGEYLLPPEATFESYPGRLPTFEDHTDLVFDICDHICDRMDAIGL